MEHWRVEIDATVLATIVEMATSLRAGICVLEGQQGAGATTLATAAAAELKRQGIQVHSVIASPELRSIPFGAMASVLATVRAAADAPVAERLHLLLASLAPTTVAPVLIVDDAPSLDDLSAATIRQLVHSYGVRCIVTTRLGAELPEPLARLDDEGLVRRIGIPPLAASVAADLVAHVVGERIEATSLQRLIERSGGIPLLLRGLLQSAVDNSGVHQTDSGIVIDERPLPPRMALSIAAQFADLGDEVKACAELLSVAGRIPVGLIEQGDAVRSLTLRGLATTTDGVVSIARPLHAETVRSLLSVSRVDELRITAAALLAHTGNDDQRFASIVLASESTQPPSTADMMWAAQRANTVDHRAVAITLADRAISLAAGRDESIPAEALLVRADALSISGRLDEADETFREALALADNDELLAATAVRAGFHFAIRRRQPDRAAAIWSDVGERITDPVARRYLSTNVLKWQLMSGAVGEPDSADDAVAHETDEVDPAAALNPIFFQLPLAVFAGDIDRARALIARGRSVAEAARHRTRHGTDLLDFGEFLVILLEGRLEDALAFAEMVHPDRFDEAAGMWAYGTALAHYHAGRLDEALRLATKAVEQLAWRDFLGALGAATGLKAAAAAQLGLIALATEVASGMNATPRTFLTAELQVAEAEGWMLAAAGDHAGMVERITAAVRLATDSRHWTFAVMTASLATRLGHPEVVLAASRAAGVSPTAPIVDLLVGHADALARTDAAGLLVAAEALSAAGFAASAHDAARQAAEIARASGSSPLARRARDAQSRIAERLTPRPLSDGPADVLSPRELAVVQLAANRARNREIAEQLGLSTRTVESHLANAFKKLGINNRDELAASLE
ncbi:MAG: LuxR C-terminal-related transcriptional regulator [Rhodoglobus sp.]